MKDKYIIFFLILLSIFSACNSNPLDVDVSGVDTKVEIHRFERDIFATDTGNVFDQIISLETKYSDYFELYNSQVISIGGTNTKAYGEHLLLFVTSYNDVYSDCQEEFPDLKDVELKLTDAFRHYRYYFPEHPVPEIYTHISGFNQSIVLAENVVSISLEKYFGKESHYYSQLGWPVYLRARMEKYSIPFDVMYTIGSTEFEMDESRNNMCDNMIYRGILMYYMDAMFPSEPDSLKIGFSSAEINWCKENEDNMWTYMVENKKLFVTDFTEIRRYVDMAPFTANFSQQSPGRAGVWQGWQVVRSYMKNNPEVGLLQLLKETDYQMILNKSRYNP